MTGRESVARRLVPPAVLWVVITAGATAVSTAGVSMVGSEVTDSHPTLSAGRVDELAAAPGPAGPSVTSTTAAPAATTTTSPPVATAPPTTARVAESAEPPHSPEPPAPQSATFAARGGVITVTCRGPQITLDSARPNDGYQLIVHDDGPERVGVEFAGEAAREFIGAACRDGHPMAFDGRKRREPPRDDQGPRP